MIATQETAAQRANEVTIEIVLLAIFHHAGDVAVQQIPFVDLLCAEESQLSQIVKGPWRSKGLDEVLSRFKVGGALEWYGNDMLLRPAANVRGAYGARMHGLLLPEHQAIIDGLAPKIQAISRK